MNWILNMEVEDPVLSWSRSKRHQMIFILRLREGVRAFADDCVCKSRKDDVICAASSSATCSQETAEHLSGKQRTSDEKEQRPRKEAKTLSNCDKNKPGEGCSQATTHRNTRHVVRILSRSLENKSKQTWLFITVCSERLTSAPDGWRTPSRPVTGSISAPRPVASGRPCTSGGPSEADGGGILVCSQEHRNHRSRTASENRFVFLNLRESRPWRLLFVRP